MERVKNSRVVGHWVNWDQLVSKESGNAAAPSPAAMEGARNSALYAIHKNSRKWCRLHRAKRHHPHPPLHTAHHPPPNHNHPNHNHPPPPIANHQVFGHACAPCH